MEAWAGGIESWIKVLGFGASGFLKVFNAAGSGFFTSGALGVLKTGISCFGHLSLWV